MQLLFTFGNKVTTLYKRVTVFFSCSFVFESSNYHNRATLIWKPYCGDGYVHNIGYSCMNLNHEASQ